ncbi:MAG: Nif11-like leader peptide family RiPP precursor [Cyanobacteria bacterium]|nr:Nif11-like leader peptide family RiPP precursor [Cyanobacteriota bacterium]
MGLHHLDAFLLHARSSAPLQERLQQPLDLEAFLQLARQEGFPVEESDVLAAQQREEGQLSDEELQQRAGAEARRLRSFIPG